MIYVIKQFMYRQDIICNLKNCGNAGYYLNKEEALNAVKENRCDLFEGGYDYSAVMGFEPGLYNTAEEEIWFKWSESDDRYIECERPKELENFTYLI